MVFGFEIFEVFHKVLGKLFQLNSLIHEFTSTSDAPWENGPFLLLQQDNLAAQNEDNIKRLAFVNDASVSFARKSPPLKRPPFFLGKSGFWSREITQQMKSPPSKVEKVMEGGAFWRMGLLHLQYLT